jgi:hypothetical protein
MDNPLDNPAISPPYRTGTLQSFQSNDTERELELNRNQHEQAKEELSNIIGRFTRTAVCGRPFILVGELTRHLQSSESPSLSEPDATSPRWTSDFDRLWKSSIFRKTGGAPDLNAEKLRRSTALFFILLQLDYPELTAEFLHYGLDDSMLPLDRETLTRKMRGTIEGYLRTPDPVPKVPKCWDEFVDMFLKEQQAWCPAKLELNFGSRNVGTQILPFYEKFPISSIQKDPKPSAHGASVCMIEVPEDFVGDKLKKELSGAKYEVSTRSRDLRDIEEGKREIVRLFHLGFQWLSPRPKLCLGKFGTNDGYQVYRFALKQFPPEKNEAFEEERIALEALRKLSGMVGYIGWYECIDISPPEMLAPAAIPPSANTHPSHCILLELGDYDFNEAMIEEAPPDLPGEIKTFWKELLGISDALVAIHKFDIDGTTYHGYVSPENTPDCTHWKTPRISNKGRNRWHGDIKPENILVVRGTYKLADPGEARIKRETTVDKRSRPPRAAVMGGTRTYG